MASKKEWRPTITDKAIDMMNAVERSKGNVLPTLGGNSLALTYYIYHHGFNDRTGFFEFYAKVGKGEVPPFESVTRAIRKAREIVPRWRQEKETVDDKVHKVKEEVGY